MSLLPRARRRAERAPRLVLRFAIFTAIGLGCAAAAILVVVRHQDVVQAEQSAIGRARLVAEAVLRHELRPRDVAGPVRGARRRELDALFSERVLLDGTLRATVYSARGAVTYSTDHRLIGGRTADRRRLAEAARDVVSTVDSGGLARADKVLATYVPVVLGPERRRAIVLLEQDYAPIAAAARQTLAPIAAVLEGVLLLLLVLLAPVLARVSRRIRRHVDELDHLATHDDLTGLENRLGFGRQLAAAVAPASDAAPAAVVLVDLDRFRAINDSLGSRAGDELLRQTAGRVAGAVEARAVARVGADEFAILLDDCRVDEAVAVAGRVRRALSQPLMLDGVRVAVEGTAGVALAPVHAYDAESVLRRAGVALRIAKERRTGVEVYDAGDDASDVALLTLTAELREAIDAGQLIVHYQLQADTATGAPHGVEALVRWRHPQRGLVPPGSFLQAAESTGLVKELGRTVLQTAVRDWRLWQENGLDLDVSVNLTAVDLLDLSLPDDVADVLGRATMPPERLVLEVTESALMGDERRTEEVLAGLVALGVRLSIDDFGTGYSSLAQLRRLPVHEVKIDRSFVAGVPENTANASMVRWTVELAHGLGLRAVGEGVERHEQWEHLRAIGCDRAQGYLLGRPVPADEVAALVRRAVQRRIVVAA